MTTVDDSDRLRAGIEEALRCLTLIGHRDGTLRGWPAKAQAAATVLHNALTNHGDPA